MITITVELKTGRLDRVTRAMRDGTGAFRRAYEEWGVTYSRAMTRRFDECSAGAGEWPPLAESTLRRSPPDRKGILHIKGRLRRAVKNLLAVPSPRGVSIQLGSLEQYEGGMTAEEVASFHQEGGPNLPQRRLLVPPGPAVLREMGRLYERAFKEEWDA